MGRFYARNRITKKTMRKPAYALLKQLGLSSGLHFSKQ